MALRMDDRKQRIIVNADGGEGIDVFGWEVADAAALDALAARLEAAGVKVARGSRALADERLVKDLIVLADPLGNRLEIFHGAQVASDPFKPGRDISGFRTGPLGLGHVVFNVESVEQIDQKVMPFYRDLLGFRLTDYYSHPFEACFLHVNPRHHSLAFIQTGKNAVHHIMMEVFSLRRYRPGLRHRARQEGRVATTLGRHTVGFHHLVLFLDAVGLHGRIRLGRALDRSRHLAGLRAQGRSQHVGPRPRLAAGGAAGRSAQDAARASPPRGCAGRCR